MYYINSDYFLLLENLNINCIILFVNYIIIVIIITNCIIFILLFNKHIIINKIVSIFI